MLDLFANLQQTAERWIALLFPLREDADRVRQLTQDILLSHYRPITHNGVVALLPFRNEAVRSCIHETKYHDNRQATHLIATVLLSHIAKQTPVYVIPIPLSDTRKRERGHNQVERIVTAMPRRDGVHIDCECLYRAKETPPQTTLTKEEREINMRDAFAVYDTSHAHSTIRGAHIVVVDDVTTTGATLRAAKAALLPHAPASITCLALAH